MPNFIVGWRKPDSTFAPLAELRYAPKEALKEIGESATVNEGHISWHLSSRFSDFSAAISGSILILGLDSEELNEDDSSRLVSTAVSHSIRSTGSNRPVSVDTFKRFLVDEVSRFFEEPDQEYYFVSGLSFAKDAPSRIDFGGWVIEECTREEFPYPHQLVAVPSYVQSHLINSAYKTYSLRVSGKTESQAMFRGSATMYCLVGLSNLLITFRQRNFLSFSSVPDRKFCGRIHISPVSTLHRDRNDNSITSYLYEPGYTEDVSCIEANDWSNLLSQVNKTYNMAESGPCKNEIRLLLQRYCAAMHQSVPGVALVILWGILEKITNTVGAHYDKLIERACWHLSDGKSVAGEILNQARLHRNLFVHSAHQTEQMFGFVRMVKEFVDMHMLQLIRNDFKISKFSQYAEILSMPSSLERLQELKNLYDLAISTKSPKSEDQDTANN